MATQDDYIRTALRVPPSLHAQIHEAAKGNNRTFNAEIVSRLESSFGSPSQAPSANGNFLLDHYARMSADAMRTQILLLESEATQIHRLVLDARMERTKALSQGADDKVADAEEYIEHLTRLADAADTQATALRAQLHAYLHPNTTAQDVKPIP